MMNFCTYFDSFYLLKGLGLYESLLRVSKDFHLYVMAIDKDCYERLKDLNLGNMTVELLSDIETPEMLAVKPTRSRGEYCWTCGPSIIYHFILKYKLESITYLDSDLMFFSDPRGVFEEVGDASIAITEQGISEKSAKLYGKYCVQYMTFRNDSEGIGALTWWRDACLDWCFQKMEDTRYGDQKYLDQFPIRWKNVHIIENLGVGIAPWNMHRYEYKNYSLSYKGKDYPFVFFHFHGTKLEIKANMLHIRSLDSELNNELICLFFQPYAELLKGVLNKYMGYHIEGVVVHDMPFFNKVDYRLRAHLRNNTFVRWVWFSLLHKKNMGHGLKI